MKASVTIPVNDANEWNMVSQFMDVLEGYRAQQKAPVATPKQAEQTLPAQGALVNAERTGILQGGDGTPAAKSLVSVTEAISAFKAYAEKNGIPAARAVLDKIGVKRAGDITEAQVPALLEAIK